MFIDNKYTKWYFEIIERYGNLNTTDYTEKHHIIPKSLGGKNETNNIVRVSARVHFILHLLLLKMTEGSHLRSMSYAFVTMRRSNKSLRNGINSRLFETYKKIASKQFLGEKNPFYGKGFFGKDNPMYGKPCHYKMTEEEKNIWKQNISKGIIGEKNPFYGKKHSEDMKKYLSEKRSKYITVFFKDDKIEKFRGYGDLGVFLGKSKHLGAKLLKPQFIHLWKKYNIERIEVYENKEDQESVFGKSL